MSEKLVNEFDSTNKQLKDCEDIKILNEEIDEDIFDDEDEDVEEENDDNFIPPLKDLLLNDDFLNSDEPLNLFDYNDDEIDWLNDESLSMLNRGYLLRGETVLGAIHRICDANAKTFISNIKNIESVTDKTINYNSAYKHFVRNVVLGWQSFSSPVWSNSGLIRGLPISCFGVYLSDDLVSISNKMSEVIMQTKIGGGTSGYFGELRYRGAPITNNGKTSGSVSFMSLFDSIISVVSQGSTRRGAFAAYLDIDHKDIEEFLTIKSIGSKIQNLFYGVNVPDWWMRDMIAGDKEKRDIWAKVLESRQQKGLPYILFIDTINRKKPQIYKELGMHIYASNLCFTGDTIVAVADGTNGKTIKELAEYSNGKIKFPVYSAKLNKSHKKGKSNGGLIYNNYWKPEIKNAIAFKTGTKKVIEITLSNGDKFKCTEDHLLATKTGEYVEAINSLNYELEPFFTFTEQDKHSKYRHINSVTNGYRKQHLMLWDFYNLENYGHIDHIENNLEYPDVITNLQTLSKEEHLEKTANERTGLNNPIFRIKDRDVWLRNLSRAQFGSNNSNYNGISSKKIIEICRDYIKENNIDKMTNKLYDELCYGDYNGILPKYFSKNRFKGSRKYLFDIVNNNIEYDMELETLPEKLESKINNEINSKRNERINYINNHFYDYKDNDIYLKGLKVVNIEEKGIEDVYDLRVEDNENFYIITSTNDNKFENCQGILVHNCSEICLPSSENESFVCCLSSMNLELYDEWKDSDAIWWATAFLDSILTEFINKGKDIPHLEPAIRFAERHRAIGLGVMGYHSYLQKNMIPFESWEAKQINAQIFKQLNIESTDASCELADLMGPAPIFEELKNKNNTKSVVVSMRNATTLAIAPTTSSSSILGQVSPGIEPFSSNYYKAGLAKGNYMRTNKYLKKLLKEKGKDTEDVWHSILLYHGSVQHLSFLSEHEKAVFKTFKEISPSEIITHAAQRQQYIDQMQSLNLLIPAELPIKEVNKLMIQAWESGVKSLYYQRSTSVSKELLTDFVNCQSCVV